MKWYVQYIHFSIACIYYIIILKAFTWMNSVVPAAESIHGIYLYGIVLVGPGRLPKVGHYAVVHVYV